MPVIPLSPKVRGPLSECSRLVAVDLVIPSAGVTIVVFRGSDYVAVGHVESAVATSVNVPLNAGEVLAEYERVNAQQTLRDGTSRTTSTILPDNDVAVQRSVADFGPPSMLSHVYTCSRGFWVGGMRPGTEIQVLLPGGSVIGNGVAVDGTALVTVPGGIPHGASLVLRQIICPKPPPSPPAPNYVVDTTLPPALLFPYQSGQTIPAPEILSGLAQCSRSIQLAGVLPGAEVVLVAEDGSWFVGLPPSDNTERTIDLPFEVSGLAAVIRQEVSPLCQTHSEQKRHTIALQTRLPAPDLWFIYCNTTPWLFARGLKKNADVEFSVTVDGRETIYPTVAGSDGMAPAPPMPVGALVRVRQGECDLWSDWSDPPQTANAMLAPPTQPHIPHELFGCQTAVPVENVFPFVGYVHVMSTRHGELKVVPVTSMVMTIPVAPVLEPGDEIWVEHRFCGQRLESNHRTVKGRLDAQPGEIQQPLFDGDTVVIVKRVTAGAWVELWVDGGSAPVQQGLAPFSDDGQVDVAFSQFGKLKRGQQMRFETWFCGQHRVVGPVPVVLRAPIIDSLAPKDALQGSGPLVLAVLGRNFRSGTHVFVHFPGTASTPRTTTFISETEVRAQITADDAATPVSFDVQVENPDGQLSASKPFSIVARPTPPLPTPTGWTLVLDAEPNPVLPVPRITIDEIKWTVTPAWNPAAQRVLTGTHSGTAVQASGTFPPPSTGSAHTVTITAEIKCSTSGGLYEGFTVPPGPVNAALNVGVVGYDGKNQKIGWLCRVEALRDTSGEVEGIAVHGIVLSIADI